MKRNLLRIFMVVALVVSLSFVMVACFGGVEKDDSYVEVTALRADKSTIYLAPEGNASTAQIKINILPIDATNQKLNYFIPSEFLSYVTVSNTGLLTAKKNTPEGVVVPVTVTSSTNSNAKTIVNVIVEEKAVTKLYFEETSTSFTIGDRSRSVAVIMEPAHAVDGRTIRYESADTEVCSVDSSGLLTPGTKTGTVIIKAISSPMGSDDVIASLTVEVKYVESNFELKVTEGENNFVQTTGEPLDITFQLIPNEGSDPKPSISWYDEKGEVEASRGKFVYKHTPTKEERATYKITAKVQCWNEDEKVYTSEKYVEIFEPFNGFGLAVDGAEKNKTTYNYLQNVTFELNASSSGVKEYQWYLSEVGSTKKEKVGTTIPTNKNLTKKLNIEGNYELEVVSMGENGLTVGTPTKIKFSVIRYRKGDTIKINPTFDGDSRPPESYTWNKITTDINGNQSTSKTHIGGTGRGEAFTYILPAGTFVIETFGTLDGQIAQINGEYFYVQTNIFYVSEINEELEWDDSFISSSECDIDNLVIDGITTTDGDFANVYWDNTQGDKFVVEVTKGGTQYLLDSEDSEYASYFGDYSVTIPSEIATLEDNFSVRVKTKGTQFSESYYYGEVAPSVEKEPYYFGKIEVDSFNNDSNKILNNIVWNVNGYIRNVKEMGDLLRFITLYRPQHTQGIAYSVNSESGIDKNVYAVNVYIDFDYLEYLDYYYGCESAVENLEYTEIFSIVGMAMRAYTESSYEDESTYTSALKNVDGTYTISIVMEDSDRVLDEGTQIVAVKSKSNNYSKTPYGKNNTEFAINSKKDQMVYDGDQLYTAIVQGYKPVAGNALTIELSNKIKEIINTIIGTEMDDFDKVLAIYDYLTTNIVYDTNVYNDLENSSYDHESFHLESALLKNQAVCDGISKALSALCGFVGIETERVIGTIGGTGHAWNKVKVDNEWYVIDATWGSLRANNGDTLEIYTNYDYFLMTDAEFTTLYTDGVAPIIYGEFESAITEYDFYEDYKVKNNNYLITSIEDFRAVVEEFSAINGSVYVSFKVDTTWYNNMSSQYPSNTLQYIMQEVKGETFDDVIVGKTFNFGSEEKIIRCEFTAK